MQENISYAGLKVTNAPCIIRSSTILSATCCAVLKCKYAEINYVCNLIPFLEL